MFIYFFYQLYINLNLYKYKYERLVPNKSINNPQLHLATDSYIDQSGFVDNQLKQRVIF